MLPMLPSLSRKKPQTSPETVSQGLTSTGSEGSTGYSLRQPVTAHASGSIEISRKMVLMLIVLIL